MKNNKQLDVACEAIGKYQRFLSLLRYGHKGMGPINTKRDRDHYGFIPKGPYSVINALMRAEDLLEKHNHRPPDIEYKFLDAGCGAGNIMLLASCLGFDVWGIERDGDTVKLARKLLYYTNCLKRGRGIIKADLVKYKEYGKYDVIYYYQPMFSNKMGDFVNALCKQMKEGAIVIPFGSDRRFRKDERFKMDHRRGTHMYRKIKP